MLDVIQVEMYYIYLKKDLEINPHASKVCKSYRDVLAAQAYALRMSNAYDVVMLKVDSEQFNPNNFNTAIIDDKSIYYQEGILDVTFYAQKKQMKRRQTYIRYSPRGFFATIYHNFGLLMRMCLFVWIAYTFVDALQANSITVVVPQATGAGTSYDVSSGAKYIAHSMHDNLVLIYNYAVTHLSSYGIKI